MRQSPAGPFWCTVTWGVSMAEDQPDPIVSEAEALEDARREIEVVLKSDAGLRSKERAFVSSLTPGPARRTRPGWPRARRMLVCSSLTSKIQTGCE